MKLRAALKSAGKGICVLAAAPTLLLTLCAGALFVQERRARWRFDSLVATSNHQAVARAALALMERVPEKNLLLAGKRLAELSPEIAAMRPTYVFISQKRMILEFHGGFDHYGFKIADQEVCWDMSWYDEEHEHLLLSIAKDEQAGKRLAPLHEDVR